jgi:hypothetical protein
MSEQGVFYAGLAIDGIAVQGRIYIYPDRIEARAVRSLDAGESLVLAHTARDVEVLVARLMPPWAGMTLLLRSQGRCIPATMPIWKQQRVVALLRSHGYTPQLQKRWLSTGYLEQQ